MSRTADRLPRRRSPSRCSTRSNAASEDAAPQDVRVLRSAAPRRGRRREEARRRRPRDAESRAAQRRDRERGIAAQAGRGRRRRCSTAIPRSTSRTRSRWSIDDAAAFVMSLNWETAQRDARRATTRSSPRTRRKSPRSRSASMPTGIARTSRRTRGRRSSGATPTAASASRISSTARKHTLWLQNERYQDAVIIERVVRAARRGVKVHIIARPPHTLKADKLIEGVGGLRIMQRRRRQGAQAEGPAPARQDAARRRRARDRRLDQPGARELRRAARARHRGRRLARGRAAREGRQARLGSLRGARPHGRRTDGRPRKARQGRRRRRPRARCGPVEGQAPARSTDVRNPPTVTASRPRELRAFVARAFAAAESSAKRSAHRRRPPRRREPRRTRFARRHPRSRSTSTGTRAGMVLANQHATVVRESACNAVVDGDFGYGQVIGREAMDIATARRGSPALCALAHSQFGPSRSHRRVGRAGRRRPGSRRPLRQHVGLRHPGRAASAARDRRLSANPIAAGAPRPMARR